MSKKHILCVYGTLRQGGRLHDSFLAGSDFLGTFKSNPIYEMRSNGAFPYLLPNGETSITLEAYSISDETLHRTDYLEGVPTHYQRRDIETPWGSGFIYIASLGTAEYAKSLHTIPSGDWITHRMTVDSSMGVEKSKP